MNTRLSSVASALAALGFAVSAQAAGIPGQGTWETVLQGRDLDRDGTYDAYYDTDQDITWLADARVTRTLGLGSNGRMEWQQAMDWVATFDVAGVKGWRLYKTFPISPLGNCTFASAGAAHDCEYNVAPSSSEMAHLYYVILGNVGAADTVGWGQPGNNTGPFANLSTNHFWSETSFIGHLDKLRIWNFGASNGMPAYQDLGTPVAPAGLHHVWPVLDGDAGLLVPEPETYLMMFAGLLGIAAAVRRRRAAAT